MLYTIEKDNVIVIPIDYNVFWQTACDYKKDIRYSKEYTLTEKVFNQLEFYLSNVNEEKFVAIDMENIVSYPSRIFSRLNVYNEKVFFYNVSGISIKSRLSEDIDKLQWIREDVAAFSANNRVDIENLVDDVCVTSRKVEQSRILKHMVQCNGDVQLLASSGMYSDYYVNIKQLFTNVKDFYYIMFCLAGLVNRLIKKGDAFVSSSKNGAIIANILGGLLDIKEVHLIGVGPKYAMQLCDSIDCIKEGKRYIYIFDFMCTGTELKIVSALVNSKKAQLVCASGIAKYEKDKNSQLSGNMHVLVETKDMDIDYKIAGTREDVIKLRRK